MSESTTSRRLADHTTTRVGGEARHWVRAETEAQAVEAITAADAAGEALFVLGGGSNTLMADAGFAGTVVQMAFTGIEVLSGDADAGAEGTAVLVRIAAGHVWDDAVAWSVQHELAGIEALSGIPGSAGATPVQNVGAYGAEVSRTIVRVSTWDRRAREVREFEAAERVFDLLMGSSVAPRKEFIVSNADELDAERIDA